MEFTVGSCVRFGWDTFKKRPWFFIGVSILIAFVSGLSSQLSSALEPLSRADMFLVGIVLVVASMVVSVLLKMGTINLLLRAHEAPESAKFTDLWAPQPFWTFVLAGITVGIIAVVGFILLIVPGVVWSLRYMFVPYLVMDRKLGVSEALAESSRITKGHKWQLLGLVLVLVGVNILGAVLLLVGLLVSIPVTYLALVHAYRALEHKANEVAAAA